MAPVSTTAVLLRSHDYGDSSRILRFYTQGYGLLSVMAHGARGKAGKGATMVASFATGDLTAYVKSHRDLHTMKDFTCTHMRAELGRDVLRFAGASAAAEVVLAHAEQEPHPELFRALEGALDRLEHAAKVDVPAAVLSALWTLIEALGFAPQIDTCVACGERLVEGEVARFDLAAGGVRCPACSDSSVGPRVGPRARGQLRELLAGAAPEGLTHAAQHLGLVTDFLAHHVVSRPLKSLHFLSVVLPKDAGAVP